MAAATNGTLLALEDAHAAIMEAESAAAADAHDALISAGVDVEGVDVEGEQAFFEYEDDLRQEAEWDGHEDGFIEELQYEHDRSMRQQMDENDLCRKRAI
ncbi:hypothetical protein M885DRAFT_573817 [Pelagophyceae sp. CCMP2097]|nr:hypothetical protein M885DRAFT_573817 [Pelagophyceae sp. CCMP2097]